MSCCGKKRAEFSVRRTLEMQPEAAASAADTEPVRRQTPLKTFEYTGSGVLSVRGAVSGEVYRFGPENARVEVVQEDAFAMMAEPELQPVRYPDRRVSSQLIAES